jgi:arabinose-5-phosphate isomerase
VAEFIKEAVRVFEIEASAILGLIDKLDSSFDEALQTILNTTGRVIVCGMGKSGLIGRKIVATLASTGTPSFFMHPGEAYHGDLGMVSSQDIFIAISNSGETEEVIKLIPFLKGNKNILISLTGNPNSTLAKSSNYHLNVGVEKEACPLQLAPSSSTTAALAMGDAIAISLMTARKFQPENFARFHPGGSLGRRLLLKVEDEMVFKDLPFILPDASIMEVISVISNGRLGMAIVQGEKPSIITDGDLRRALERYEQGIFAKKAGELMTTNPVTVVRGTRVEDALKLMDSKRISSLIVLDNGAVAGVFRK